MTPIEILAIIIAVFILLKLSIITINPKFWMKIAEAALSNYTITTITYLLLAVVVGYYIFNSLNIVQVAAVMLFTSLLIGLGFIPYSEIILKAAKERLGTRRDMFRKAWLSIVIWAGIAIWVLYSVFA